MREQLRENLGENPLKFWEKDKARCEILLKDPDNVIRVKPMWYTPPDREEFRSQIKELLKMGLIRSSASPHSSLVFMVRNDLQKKKPRMVINYKKLNSFTILDGYFLPNKESLIKEVQEKIVFSKFDCKAGYWGKLF